MVCGIEVRLMKVYMSRYTAHQSFVDADEVRVIQGPLSIAAAGTLLFTLPFLTVRICKFHCCEKDVCVELFKRQLYKLNR